MDKELMSWILIGIGKEKKTQIHKTEVMASRLELGKKDESKMEMAIGQWVNDQNNDNKYKFKEKWTHTNIDDALILWAATNSWRKMRTKRKLWAEKSNAKGQWENELNTYKKKFANRRHTNIQDEMLQWADWT